MKESNSPRKYVAPIALDLGATHTGVYRAIYPRGTAITEIPEKRGEVLKLSPDKYTFLMRDRTAKRHMRRCIDRKKLAKRLLNVVLRDYFGFLAEEHDQALGFLLNRRGYTRLEETLHLDALDDFPDEAWQALPKKVRELLGGSKDKLKVAFEQLLSDNQEGLIQLYQSLIENTIAFIKEKQEARSAAKRLIEILKGADKPLKIGNKSISNTHIRILTEKGADSLDQINPLSKKELEGLNPSQKEKLIGELELAIKALEEDLKQFAKEVDISPQAVAMLGKVKGNFEWEKDGLKIQSGDAAAHLDHLTTGLIKAHEEITSGGRHRRKYFEEIKQDLERAINSVRENTNSQQDTRPETGKEPVHGYMRRFAAALEKHDTLDGEKIYQLLAHIANLELKPLRAYFNDPRHKGGDKWLPEEFNKIIPRWFLKNWRVSEQKDGLEKVRNYQKLKQAWEQHKQTASKDKADAVEFWLKTDPELTIPPYQSHTNRRPPHCQSLVLNTAYMDEHYSQWKTWLSLLDTTAAPDLSGLKNRYGSKPLLQEHELNRRRLQFLLDRTKSLDPYRLNAIWSRHHQRQKYPEDSPEYLQADEKLREEIAKSQLPDELKHDLDFNAEGSFGHFINKYYNSRRKAKDSRIFIHPLTKPAVKALNKEHSEKLKRNPRWNDKNHLLTLCPHRPRQKQHQMLSDIAAVLGLTAGQLEQKLDDTGFDSVEQLLLSVHGLKTTAEQAALAQKKFKGQLKNLLQRGKQLLKQEKKPSREQNELIQLEQKCKQKAQLLAERLWPELPKEEQAAKASRFRSIHSFAQIYNLVFKDRSGFSSTCPACSTDNAGRMVENKDGTARASRLPALSIRLIDGAVRKMAEYLAHHLAERHWQLIKEPLFNGNKVCVPLILEQNRFEFEPNLRKIKGGNIPSKLKNEMEKQEQQLIESYQRKQQRIKESAGGICAYTGDSLADNGEIDHIIPRSSRYGTLNDEANLIYVSERGNKLKGNRVFFLADLNDRYKQHQFEGKTDKEIKQWIWQTLTGQPPHENPSFVFGRYLNFDNLSKDQQTAFRHALFLDSSDSLRQKVLEAIQNRNRTYVNGTQRFVAQVIADKLHQMAERNGKESQLEFDYFEYPADPNHPKGVQNLRRQIADAVPELEKHEKQEDYSHHIDAHMAFLLAADEHRNDGSMGLRFEENPERGYKQTVWPKPNGGELDPWLETHIPPKDVPSPNLERQSNNAKIDREIIQKKNRPLSRLGLRQCFTQQAIGISYRPLVQYRNQWFIGYPAIGENGQPDMETYAEEAGKKESQLIQQICQDGFFYELARGDGSGQFDVYQPKKREGKKSIDRGVEQALGAEHEKYAQQCPNEFRQIKFILQKAMVLTKKTPLVSAPSVLNNARAKKHPSIERWESFDRGWRRQAGEHYQIKKDQGKLIYDLGSDELRSKWDKYCRNYLGIKKPAGRRHYHHRKEFSMKTVGTSSGTNLLINRHGKGPDQTVPLDNNEIAKAHVPFIIKKSGFVSWPKHDAPKHLKKPMQPVNKKSFHEKVELANILNFDEDRLKEAQTDFQQTQAYVSNTKVELLNFPLAILEKSLVLKKPEDLYEKKSFDLLTEKRINANVDDSFAIKSQIDQWLKRATRDGALRILKVHDAFVDIELPFKDASVFLKDKETV